jgi:arginine N-succinyltransferase
MMRLRQATMNDLNGIHRLAIDAGIGITTLPKDKSVLETRLKLSCNSFKKQVTEPQDEYYLFVLEDTTTGTIAGTSAIEANLGHALPFYSYKLSTRTRTSKSLKIRTDYQVLSLVNDLHGYSEICTLYLAEPYRKDYNGQLLSRSRFLYMAIHPERFSDKIIADMRGHSDEHGIAPFWEAIGKHFFKMSFEDADSLTLATDKQLIIDLMPRNPIYVSLLPQSAQEIIAKPHPHSLPCPQNTTT